MPKTPIWRNKILEVLENKSLNYESLFDIVKSEINCLGREYSRNKDRQFNEPLVQLLKEGKIVISGYDINVHRNKKGKLAKRIQSFVREGVIFEKVKIRDIEEIRALLDQLDGLSSNEIKYARDELQKLFTAKIKQYEKQENGYWDKLKKKVKFMPIDGSQNEVECYLPFDIDEISRKSKNAKIWYFEPQSVKDIMEIMGMGHIPDDDDWITKSVGRPAVINGELVRSFTPSEIYETSDLMIGALDEDGDWDIESFLEKKEIPKPVERKNEEIKKMFRDILFYINSLENNKFLKNAFSLALSDDEESLDYFEQFISDTSYITQLKEKLQELLDSLKFNS